MNHQHWDTLTNKPCTLIQTIEVGSPYAWIRFQPNGRPKTRHREEVIRLADHEARQRELARQAQQAQVKPYWYTIAEAEQLAHVCDVQQATLKWLHEHAIKYRKDYNAAAWPPPILSIVTQDSVSTPQWVLDCLATVNG